MFQGQNIGGTVVPPASHSNHLCGHAIDFNLETPSGWCNGDCLAWKTNSYAKCFTDKVGFLKLSYKKQLSLLIKY